MGKFVLVNRELLQSLVQFLQHFRGFQTTHECQIVKHFLKLLGKKMHTPKSMYLPCLNFNFVVDYRQKKPDKDFNFHVM